MRISQQNHLEFLALAESDSVNGLNTALPSRMFPISTLTGAYPVVGLFGEKYVALSPTDASKLTKLVVDSKDKFTVTRRK